MIEQKRGRQPFTPFFQPRQLRGHLPNFLHNFLESSPGYESLPDTRFYNQSYTAVQSFYLSNLMVALTQALKIRLVTLFALPVMVKKHLNH